MKTHELAKALNHLSRVLRAGPNIELDGLANLSTYVDQPRPKKASRDTVDKGAALVLLAQMAQYSKRELIDLAQFLNIPLEIRSADAVRDVLGKILKYIQDNPTVQDRLLSSASSKQPDSIPPLAKALAILMNQS